MAQYNIGGDRVEPVLIDSALVSAQSRKRLYWTNKAIQPPQDRGVDIASVLGCGKVCARMVGRKINPETGRRDDYNPNLRTIQYIECKKDLKSHTLTTVDKDNVVVSPFLGRRKAPEVDFRYLTPNEYEALQTLPRGYTRVASNSRRKRAIGNGWTVEIISYILKQIL